MRIAELVLFFSIRVTNVGQPLRTCCTNQAIDVKWSKYKAFTVAKYRKQE